MGQRLEPRAVLAVVDRHGLPVPTAPPPHQIDGLLSIDHIAAPTTWQVRAAERHRAISNHDPYVIEDETPTDEQRPPYSVPFPSSSSTTGIATVGPSNVTSTFWNPLCRWASA